MKFLSLLFAILLSVPGWASAEDARARRLRLRVLADDQLFEKSKDLSVDWGTCEFFDAAACRPFERPGCSGQILCLNDRGTLYRISPFAEKDSAALVLPNVPKPAVITVSDIDQNGSEDVVLLGSRKTPAFLFLRAENRDLENAQLPSNAGQRALQQIANIHPAGITANGLRRDILVTEQAVDGRFSYRAFIVPAHNVPEIYAGGPSAGGSPEQGRIPENFVIARASRSASFRFAADGFTMERELAVGRSSDRILPPEGFRWQRAFVGDFTGDGFTDVLGYAGPLARWWMLSLSSAAPAPRGVAGLPIDVEPQARVVSADLNADGQVDVAMYRNGKLQIFLGTSTPLASQTVLVNGAEIGKTDTKGEVSSPLGIAPGAVISLPLNGNEMDALSFSLDRESIIEDVSTVVLTTRHFKNARGEVVQDGPPRPGPYVCHGLPPHRVAGDPSMLLCEPQHYVVSVDDLSSSNVHPGWPSPPVNCCPLPRALVVSDSLQEVTGECPAGSLVVGVSMTLTKDPASPFPLRVACAALQENVAVRGESRAGHYFGPRAEREAGTSPAPAAIALGLGRTGLRSWDVDGCTGPVNTVLTGVLGRRCEEMRFANLETPSHAAISLFPDCKAIENRFDVRSGCSEREVPGEP